MAESTDTSPSANNGKALGTHLSQPIEESKNKFLLYGITYLLATPSSLSLEILGDDEAFKTFLRAAGVTDPGDQEECLAFAESVVENKILDHTRLIMHEVLRDDFGERTYSPTPCPNGIDSLAIMTKMNELRMASASASINK